MKPRGVRQRIGLRALSRNCSARFHLLGWSSGTGSFGSGVRKAYKCARTIKNGT